MRILNVTAQKPDSTGSGVYLAQLADALVREGHECGVIAGVAADDACEPPGATYARFVHFDTPDLPFHVVGMSDAMPYPSTRYRDLTQDMVARFEAAFVAALTEALEVFRPDVIICHHLYLLTAIVREHAGALPVFAVCHSTDMRQMKSHGLAHGRIVEAMRKLDGIFSLHREQASEIVQCYGVSPSCVTVVGTGYDARAFNCAGKPSRQMGEHDPRLVFVGKICRSKGVGCLIEAFENTLRKHPGARLDLVGGHGEGDEYGQLVAQAAPLGDAVCFVGRLPTKDLAAAYRASDVFVLPSFYEGLPLVVVEALACGCRVVVTDLPGIRPWLDANVPAAPVFYVHPPLMQAADKPDDEDLPAFEARLAQAIEQALAAPPCEVDLAPLAWDALAKRVAAVLACTVEDGTQNAP